MERGAPEMTPSRQRFEPLRKWRRLLRNISRRVETTQAQSDSLAQTPSQRKKEAKTKKHRRELVEKQSLEGMSNRN